MIIAVTGTPGTGKTAVAQELAALLDYDYVDVNAFADRDEVATDEDVERGATAVDIESLVDALVADIDDDAVLDGHLAHHVPADLTVVLRCAPETLRERLREKGWGEEKIRENVEAEALDLILQEAVAAREAVAEIDTTGSEPVRVAETIKEMADGVPEEHRPGMVDWSDALGGNSR